MFQDEYETKYYIKDNENEIVKRFLTALLRQVSVLKQESIPLDVE